jgi:hypothetical protein
MSGYVTLFPVISGDVRLGPVNSRYVTLSHV